MDVRELEDPSYDQHKKILDPLEGDFHLGWVILEILKW